MKQTMQEKLRLIADCIDNDMSVSHLVCGVWEDKDIPDDEGDCFVFGSREYRAKPEKPRAGLAIFIGDSIGVKAEAVVSITTEVRQALEAAGIET